MTHKELEKYFASSLYDDVRDYINEIMEMHPEITDPKIIGVAAEQMDDCHINGVEISVENALRLTSGVKFVDSAKSISDVLSGGKYGDLEKEISQKLGDVKDRSAESLLDFIKKAEEHFSQKPGSELKPTSVAQAQELAKLGNELADGNKDIVLTELPDLRWKDTRLKLAFFTDTLDEGELKILYDMRLIADRVRFKVEDGIAYATFYIDDMWEK